MMAKMKSVWAYGQEPPLGPALAEARAGDAAGRHADERLDVLVAGVLVVGPRVEEGEHPGPPVAAPTARGRWRPRRPAAASPRAGRTACRRRRAARARWRRARAWCPGSAAPSGARPPRRTRRRPGRSVRRTSSIHAARRASRSATKSSTVSLASSDGWREKRAVAEPARRAVDGDADAGDEHEHEEHRRDRRGRAGPAGASGGSRRAARPRTRPCRTASHMAWRMTTYQDDP